MRMLKWTIAFTIGAGLAYGQVAVNYNKLSATIDNQSGKGIRAVHFRLLVDGQEAGKEVIFDEGRTVIPANGQLVLDPCGFVLCEQAAKESRLDAEDVVVLFDDLSTSGDLKAWDVRQLYEITEAVKNGRPVVVSGTDGPNSDSLFVRPLEQSLGKKAIRANPAYDGSYWLSTYISSGSCWVGWTPSGGTQLVVPCTKESTFTYPLSGTAGDWFSYGSWNSPGSVIAQTGTGTCGGSGSLTLSVYASQSLSAGCTDPSVTLSATAETNYAIYGDYVYGIGVLANDVYLPPDGPSHRTYVQWNCNAASATRVSGGGSCPKN
jgi:hypothetical protein